jgi:hypothetical protein
MSPVTRAVQFVLNIGHYCKRPPKRKKLGLPREEHHEVESFLDAIRHFIINQMLTTLSDTFKVNFQRLAVLHITLFRIANAMLGELTSPAHTVAGSAGNAISSLKNEIQRMITQLALVIARYKRNEGQLSEEDEISTDYELVINNLHFIETHREQLKATGLEIGSPDLWKEDDLEGREKFLALLDSDNSGRMKQLHAVYFYSLWRSLSWTIPVTLLIVLMPYILNAAGNDVLMGEKFIALIFAITPLFTVLTAMNHSFISIFDDYLQYRLSTVEILLRDLPQIICSALGWYYQSPLLIATGQVVPSMLAGLVGSRIILNELNKFEPQKRLPLRNDQKKSISNKIRTNVIGVAASAGFRMLVPIILGLEKEHIAILSYNIFYFLVWGFLGPPRAYAQGYNNGRGQHAYDGHEKTLDNCLTYSNTMLTFIMALLALALKDKLIPLINAPTTPEALKANHFAGEWWPLGCVILGMLGASYVQQDKIGNSYDARLRLAAINLFPAIVGFFGLTPFGGDTQLIGLMLGWLTSAVISIVYGLLSSRFTGDLPSVLAARHRHQGGSQTQPLLEEHRQAAEGKASNHDDDEEIGAGIGMVSLGGNRAARTTLPDSPLIRPQAKPPTTAGAFSRAAFNPVPTREREGKSPDSEN